MENHLLTFMLIDSDRCKLTNIEKFQQMKKTAWKPAMASRSQNDLNVWSVRNPMVLKPRTDGIVINCKPTATVQ